MITLSEADALLELPKLIDRALAGEGIIITRQGLPVAELKAMPSGAHPVTDAELDWLAENRTGTKVPEINAGALLSSMRDGYER